MSATSFMAASLARYRAVEAAKRFISRSRSEEISRSTVADFLRRRRQPLPAEEIDGAAAEAMREWVRGQERRAERRRR